MAYIITKQYNGQPLEYWRVMQRNSYSNNGASNWAVIVSGFANQADRISGYKPFNDSQIVFTPQDHPITEAATTALLVGLSFHDEDDRGIAVYYLHISRVAAIAYGKIEAERSASETACLYFHGAVAG